MVMFLWHTGISSVPIEIVSYKIFNVLSGTDTVQAYCPGTRNWKAT